MMCFSRLFYTVLLSVSLIGCSSRTDYLPANDPLSAGREFMEACKNGDFGKASFYMVQDNENIQLLKKINDQYQGLNESKKKQLNQSSILILDVSYLSQSETIINYKYSYDGYARKIKVIVQPKGNWLADFKYAGNGNL